MAKVSLSFDDNVVVIPIVEGGVPANAFNPFGSGTPGKIIDRSENDDSLYLFEFADGRPDEYVWRSNLYPVPIEI